MNNSKILLLGFIFYSLHVSSVDLRDAIASKQVAVELSGSNYDSMPAAVRSGPAAPKMQMTVINLTGQPLSVDLAPGYMLGPPDPAYQAMLLTEPVSLHLGPRERLHTWLHAMCTQIHNSAPNSSLHYHVAGLARPELLKIAQFLASKKYQGYAAQEAVWSISDDMPIPSIGDDKVPLDLDLQKLAASIKGLDLDKIKKDYKKYGDVIMEVFKDCKVSRNIPFEVKDSAMVSVGYYENDSLIKPISKPTLLKEGKHSYRYDPYPLALAGRRYTVRMIRNGMVDREYYFKQ